LTHINCIIRAFWLAHIAINAFIGDDESHELDL
jgi:hypothetical protein